MWESQLIHQVVRLARNAQRVMGSANKVFAVSPTSQPPLPFPATFTLCLLFNYPLHLKLFSPSLHIPPSNNPPSHHTIYYHLPFNPPPHIFTPSSNNPLLTPSLLPHYKTVDIDI